MVAPLRRHSGGESSQVRKSSHLVSSQLWTWTIVVVVMLVNTEISRVVTSTSPWTFHWNLEVWKIWESHLWSQRIIWEDQEQCWSPLWVSRPKQCQRSTKRHGIPSEISVRRTFQRLLGSLTSYLIIFMRGGVPSMIILTVNFTYQDILWSVWWYMMPSTWHRWDYLFSISTK